LLQEILGAQARTVEENRALQAQLRIAIEELRNQRVIYMVEAPVLSLRVQAGFVEAARSSFSPGDPDSAQMPDSTQPDREQVGPSSSSAADAFQSRMRKVYPGRELDIVSE